MTTAEPNTDAQKRGRHAKRDDPDRLADETPDEATDDAAHRADDGRDGDDGDGDGDRNEAQDDDSTAEDSREETAEESPAAEESRQESADEKSAAETPAAAAAPPPEQKERPRTEQRRDEAQDQPAKKRSTHAIAHHPAGASLLTAAGLVTGLALVPLLFDQLNFEVAARAADAARSAAAPLLAGGEPWFWPGWVANTAAIVGLAVLVVAALGVRLPDLVILGTAVVLAVTTARAAWATFDVLNAHLWELIPVCIVCVLAFGSAVAAAFRWRSQPSDAGGSGAGEVAGVTIGAWLLVVLLLLGGSAIASSAETHAFGNVTSPPQDLAGLLSIRAADAPALDDLRGSWVPQVAAAQASDDAGGTAYAAVHNAWATRFPTVLARGDDTGAPDLDDTWWVSLVQQPFASQEEAAAWCTGNGLAAPACTPVLISG